MPTILRTDGTSFSINSDSATVAVSQPNQWITAYTLSFAAQGSQTLTSNGNYTVDGKPWIKQNSAADSTAMAITNNTGLVCIPNTTGSPQYESGTRTSPLFGVALSSVIPGWDPYAMAVRVWAYISASNKNANFDAELIAIDDGAANTGLNYLLKNGKHTSGDGTMKQILLNGSSLVTSGGFDSAGLTDNVLMLELPDGYFGFKSNSYSGTWSSGFPTVSAMRKHRQFLFGSAGGQNSVAAQGATQYAWFGNQRFASVTALSSTIHTVRFDYKYI